MRVASSISSHCREQMSQDSEVLEIDSQNSYSAASMPQENRPMCGNCAPREDLVMNPQPRYGTDERRETFDDLSLQVPVVTHRSEVYYKNQWKEDQEPTLEFPSVHVLGANIDNIKHFKEATVHVYELLSRGIGPIIQHVAFDRIKRFKFAEGALDTKIECGATTFDVRVGVLPLLLLCTLRVSYSQYPGGLGKGYGERQGKGRV